MTKNQIERYIRDHWDVKGVSIDEDKINPAVFVITITFSNDRTRDVYFYSGVEEERWKTCLDTEIVKQAADTLRATECKPKLYPVCVCGEILYGFKMEDSKEELYFSNNPFKTFAVKQTVTPSVCPKCGKLLTGITYKTPVNGVLEYDY